MSPETKTSEVKLSGKELGPRVSSLISRLFTGLEVSPEYLAEAPDAKEVHAARKKPKNSRRSNDFSVHFPRRDQDEGFLLQDEIVFATENSFPAGFLPEFIGERVTLGWNWVADGEGIDLFLSEALGEQSGHLRVWKYDDWEEEDSERALELAEDFLRRNFPIGEQVPSSTGR